MSRASTAAFLTVLVPLLCLISPAECDIDGEVFWLHPRPTPGTIYSMHWLSPTHGWMCTSMGELLETVDGGASFQSAVSSNYVKLFDIFFLDDARGWAVGEIGILLETTDGGQTWTLHDVGSEELYAIEFIDDTYGTIVGDNNTILRTNDGGATWTPQGTPWANDWYDVHFSSWLDGWVVGFGGIAHTNSAGAFWELQHSGYYYAIDFIDDSTGWAVGGNGVVSHTTDAGQTWTDATLPVGEILADVEFWSPQEGWIAGDGYSSSSSYCFAYHTTDGGLNWELDTMPSPYPGHDYYNNGLEIAAVGPGQAYWAGESGLLWSTDDGAASWDFLTTTATPDPIRDVYFTDTMTGWGAGGDYVIFTDDGGVTWEDRSPVPEPTSLYCVYFMDNEQTGWVGGNDGYIARTTTGGTTWVESSVGGSGDHILDIAFNSNGFGVACAWNGNVWQSDNYGVDWEAVSVGTGGNELNVVEFAGETSGYVGGQHGTILRFDLTGDSWCNLYCPHDYTVTDISALSEDLVYAAIYDGWTNDATYLYTTDGGDLWIKENLQYLQGEFLSVFFESSSLGYFVERAYKLMYTVNGAATWEEDMLHGPWFDDQSRAFFLDSGHGWISAWDSPGILAISIDMTGIGDQTGDPGPAVSTRLTVSPNPSAGIPQVYFETGITGEYELAVHDLAGRLIHSRSLGQLAPGQHQVPAMQGAKPQTLPAGLYFCTVRGGGITVHTSFVVID